MTKLIKQWSIQRNQVQVKTCVYQKESSYDYAEKHIKKFELTQQELWLLGRECEKHGVEDVLAKGLGGGMMHFLMLYFEKRRK